MNRQLNRDVILLAFFWGILFYGGVLFAAPLGYTPPDTSRSGTPADTGKTGEYRSSPDYFRNVNLKIIYAWNPEEPDLYSKVNCLLVRQANLITEIKIFQEHATERILLSKGQITFEIADPVTKKTITKGP